MTTRRWWLVALVGTAVLCLGVVVISDGIGRSLAIGGAILALFVVFWAIVARPDEEGTPRSIAVLVVTIAVATALTATTTSLAFFQAFAFPVVWTMLATIRRSILTTGILAAAEVGGFFVALGISPDSIAIAVTIETVSFVFAVAMGVWITRISELSAERARLVDELTAAQTQLEVLHRDAGATQERERLARELHDTIAQSLTGQVLLAQRARRELAAGTPSDATLELLESASRDALAETRTLVAASARVELPGGGLVEALGQLATRFQRESGIAVTVSSGLPGSVVLERDTEVVLLRCAQEGLANVRKHAAATHVRLELGTDAGAAMVRVVDDGRGFDPDRAASGFGLSGLRDRLGLVGGELSIDGTPGATTLMAKLPLAVS